MKKAYTDEEILKSIKASTETREQVFEYLFLKQELRNKAFAKIRSMVKDEAAAEDVFLDSLLAFIKNVRYNKFEGKSTVTTYIVAICRFRSLRYLEDQKKEKAEEYHIEAEKHAEQDYQMESDFFIQESQRYEARLTRRIYRQLSEGCRKAFRQKYGQALSVREIAAKNEVGVQSVKNALSRCYKKLKALITEDAEIMEIIKKRYGKL